MKKLILISLLVALANGSQSTVVVNDSKCDLIEAKYFTVNDASFVSKPSFIHSHKSAPITINFHNAHAYEDEYLAGIGYNVVCGGEPSGNVVLEFSPGQIGISFSKNTKVNIDESTSSFSRLVFTDR